MDLYIVHGWTYTTDYWEETLKLLEESGYKVKMLRVPGLTEPSRRVWTIDEYVEWADREIPDGAIALGHSNGGRILLNLCSKNPKKLEHLILLSSAGIYEKSLKKSIVRTIAKIGKPLKKIPGVGKVFHKLTGSTDYDKAPANMKKTLTNMLSSDKNLDISKVTTKTSIIWGKQDNITPPRHAEKIKASLPDATLEYFDDWNHAPYIKHPDELAKAIAKILDANIVKEAKKSKSTKKK